MVEYSDISLRNQDIIFLKQRFEAAWKFAKELEEKRQIPEFEWYFEYNWKYYTIVNWLNTLTDEINPEKWIYKWVILNPSKYFDIENEARKIADKVEDIL